MSIEYCFRASAECGSVPRKLRVGRIYQLILASRLLHDNKAVRRYVASDVSHLVEENILRRRPQLQQPCSDRISPNAAHPVREFRNQVVAGTLLTINFRPFHALLKRPAEDVFSKRLV